MLQLTEKAAEVFVVRLVIQACAAARGGRMLLHVSSLLRNSEAYQITVKNANGDLMWDSGDLGWARKTYGSSD